MPERKPIAPGTRFARLTVLEYLEPKITKSGRKDHRTRCVCDCGLKPIILERSIKAGVTKSCGCLSREVAIRRSTTHGKSHLPEYGVWEEIIQRCTNPNSKAYSDYGGRGIRICEQWRSFERFFENMGPRPKGYTIERLDNSRGYEPGNCVWATRKQQLRNTRRTINVTVLGVSGCLKDVCQHFGINSSAVGRRLKRGWPLADAVITPSVPRSGLRRKRAAPTLPARPLHAPPSVLS
jgi:hypothetical protein